MTFDQFVIARGRALWRVAFLLTGDRQKAEDLVQTALTKTYPKFRDGGAGFETYVRKAIYTTYVSWWRRRWNAETPAESVPEPTAAQSDPELSLDVLRALATLPRTQRAVLVLRYFEDRSVSDVAQLLGLSEGTVKSYAHRGVTALRDSVHLKEAQS